METAVPGNSDLAPQISVTFMPNTQDVLTDKQPPADLQILQGHAVAYFAFDIGYEVNLMQVNQLIPTQQVQPISRTKKTPTYLQYAKPPRIIPLGETKIIPGLLGQIQATIFDFGAMSISFRWQISKQGLPFPLTELPVFGKTLYDAELEAEAWRQAEALLARIKTAVTRPALYNLIEDYYIFVAERLSKPCLADSLLQNYGDSLAQLLHFEISPMSAGQRRDIVSKAISYYDDDLAIIDWNAAFILDTDFADTLNVLELMNVELLEARYMDAELDKRIEGYESLAKERPRWNWMFPLFNPYRQTIKELAELRIEAALLAERIENALKLIGDLYLARIHTAACDRFYISAWDEAISRKLDIIGNLYQLLTDRISTTQAQTLELIIILLILIEIILNFKPG